MILPILSAKFEVPRFFAICCLQKPTSNSNAGSGESRLGTDKGSPGIAHFGMNIAEIGAKVEARQALASGHEAR